MFIDLFVQFEKWDLTQDIIGKVKKRALLKWLHNCFFCPKISSKKYKTTACNFKSIVHQCRFLLHYHTLPHYHSHFLLHFWSLFCTYLDDTCQCIVAHSQSRHRLDWHKHWYNCKITIPVPRQEQVDCSSNLLLVSLHLV